MSAQTKKAVILARGLGTRMRKPEDRVTLAEDQAAAASAGVKGMIPVGRPFLDYVISALADAGFSEVCLVIGPEHSVMREYYGGTVTLNRISVEFAVQEKPLGTADAVLAAESFAGGEAFAVINSDTYYSPSSLESLRRADPPAIVGFDTRALVNRGNIPADRISRFGALEMDTGDILERIAIATPFHESPNPTFASLNCWLFDSRIFDACRKVEMSPRGELELPRAVKLGIETMGMRFTVVKVSDAALDMSTRGDIASVKEAMAAIEVQL